MVSAGGRTGSGTIEEMTFLQMNGIKKSFEFDLNEKSDENHTAHWDILLVRRWKQIEHLVPPPCKAHQKTSWGLYIWCLDGLFLGIYGFPQIFDFVPKKCKFEKIRKF